MQYGIISNIHFNDTSAMISQNVLPELQIDFDAGEWIVRDPESSDQGGVTLGHMQERQQVTTVPETEARVIATEDEDSSAPDMDCIVLEQTLRHRDWPEPEPSSEQVTGAGSHEVPPDVMQSPSSDVHQEAVTVTPPRHEPFELNYRPSVYHVLNEENQEAYAHLDDVTNGHEAEVRVNTQVHDENQRKRKRGPNKKLEKRQKIKAHKEERKKQYDLAINAFKDNQFETYGACAKNFGVCPKALKKMILSGRGYVGAGEGNNRVLTSEEEAKIAAYLKWCRQVGFGLTYHSLQSLIQELLVAVVR